MNSADLRNSLCAVPAAITAVELFILLPFRERAQAIIDKTSKSTKIMKSRKISDHWKEKAIRSYSVQIMAASLVLAGYLLAVLAVFVAVYCLSALFLLNTPQNGWKEISSGHVQVTAVVIGALYAYCRTLFPASKTAKKGDYNRSSKIFHQLVLGNAIIPEIAFDIDCSAVKILRNKRKVKSPVYITSLARSGTTVLLEAAYATDHFSTLTYRDMPFVTAPYLWSKIRQTVGMTYSQKKQRAHGDYISVNYDSPEAFEEVFWMMISNKEYIKKDCLARHQVTDDQIDQYRKYVHNIITRDKERGGARYLAKNNSNILRITALQQSFPDALIIIPFRDPVSHAKSLLSQHKHFLEMHAEDSFSKKYMEWLGHFEFGAHMKPFNFHPDALPTDPAEPLHIMYWLRYWSVVYQYLLGVNSSNIFFVHYNKLCQSPVETFSTLESILSLPAESLQQYASSIKETINYTETEKELPIPANVMKVYGELRQRSI